MTCRAWALGLLLCLPALVSAPVRAATGDLCASIVFSEGGAEPATVCQSQAEDWGDYVAKAPYNFVQHNRVAAVPAPDGQTLYVHFRPDADGSRQEVVFENGMLSQTPAYIRPYHVVIRDGEAVLADIDLGKVWEGESQGANKVTPKHWGYARWRWQSAPRPVVRRPDELIAAGLLPPYDAAYINRANPGAMDALSYAYPMDTAGITMAMGMTGERADIGLVTEYQAEYIFKPNDARALKNVIAQGEGAASIPWHIRDPKTHAPIDFYRPERKALTAHGNDHASADYYPWPTSPWGMDQSHMPAVNYLPFLLTGDPYYLEGLQGQMTFNTMWTRFQRFRDGRMVINDSQTRGYAWALRTLMQLAKVTPDSVPSWLLPRSYYARYLADNMAWFRDTYSGPNATHPLTRFHYAGTLQGDTHSSPWMEDFLATMLGWGVRMGHENMREAFAYKIRSTIDRFSGESGWPRQMGSAYHIYFRRTASDPWADSWAEAWAITQEKENPKPGFDFSRDKPLFRDGGWYEIYARGALGLGIMLGIEEARGPWDYLHRQIQTNLPRNGPLWKWAFGPPRGGGSES
jgi:hypothetical protein